MANLDQVMAQLAEKVQEKINKSLKREVAIAVRKTMQEEIKSEVYSVYTPVDYKRQYYRDGLLDPDNIEVQVLDDNMISVENITHDGDRNIAEIVESGHGYLYNVPSILTDGRKFTESTRDRLVDENILKQSMKDGLNRQGVDARLK